MGFDKKRVSRIIMGMIEDKDLVTAEHSRNVARMAVSLGRALGLEGEALGNLEIGALLHDADKLNVPEEIFEKLRSGEPLTREENRVLIEHPSLTGSIPFEEELPQFVKDCQRLHHENFNGTGGPKGIKGDQIPLNVRILQVADTYDALTLNLPGRRGQSKTEALASLKRLAGTVLDPQLVEKFVKIKTIQSKENL